MALLFRERRIRARAAASLAIAGALVAILFPPSQAWAEEPSVLRHRDAAEALPALSLRPRSLASPAGPGAGEPHLAVEPEGAVWMSWIERRARGGHALRASRLAGERWSRAITIAEGDSFFVNWADFPTLLPLGADRLVAHWPWRSGEDTYAYDVRLSQSRDGGRTWDDPVIPHRDGTQTEHGFVSMVPDRDGARMVWLDGRDFAKPPPPADSASAEAAGAGDHGHERDHNMSLRTALLHPDGRLSDEAALDARVCECCQTAAVRTDRGALAAYRDRSEEEIRDIWLVRWEGGRWTEPYSLHRDEWEIEGCPVNGPALDAAGARVAAAWYTGAQDAPRVLAAFSDDGGASFGPAARMDSGSPLGRVDVVLLADGSALVAWLESIDRRAAIQIRRVSPEGRTSPPLTVARTSAARASGFPRMVRSGDRLVLAWTEPSKPSRVKTAIARLEP